MEEKIIKINKDIELNVPKDIDQDFINGLEDTLERYDETLRNLANR